MISFMNLVAMASAETSAPSIWLGRSLDEFDGLLVGPLVSGRTGKAKVLISGNIAETSYLNLWINFNNDDEFDDISELLSQDAHVMLAHKAEDSDVYAAIQDVDLKIPENVQAGVYDLRVELNSLPEGAGDVIDFGQMRIAIMTDNIVEMLHRANPSLLFDLDDKSNESFVSVASSFFNQMTDGLGLISDKARSSYRSLFGTSDSQQTIQ
eukprot:GHVH01007036.1.p1 GENE.GHVH01007036.1~~GHVH01007036.1.p1  ORF type:complete len:210 (-),score=36.34 GHVH01007036.1:60-689(-)